MQRVLGHSLQADAHGNRLLNSQVVSINLWVGPRVRPGALSLHSILVPTNTGGGMTWRSCPGALVQLKSWGMANKVRDSPLSFASVSISARHSVCVQ